MNIFFDIQGTLISAGRPRPHVREVFLELSDMGHHIYLWSSGGAAYAAQAAKVLGVDDVVLECFPKSASLPVSVDFIVDDYPGLVEAYRGHAVPPFDGDPDDEELWEVIGTVSREAANRE